MRVALLSNSARQQDAVGNMLAERVRFFHERGAEVRLFVEDARHLHAEVRSCSTQVHEPTAEGPVWDYLRQADLVLALYPQTYALLQWLPSLVGGSGRVILEYLGVTPPAHWLSHHRESMTASLRGRGIVWCADHAIVHSRFTRLELSHATRFPEAHLSVLPPLGLDPRFVAGERERFLPDRLGIEGRILLAVGRFAGNKRLPLLIETLARLDDRTLHAVLIGDHSDVYQEEARHCLTRAHALGVGDRVHLLDPLDDADLPRAYRSAEVLVVPSLHEGFCLPVIEAMACGVPVVASRGSALKETIGGAGLSFVPDDAADLARQLERVLNRSTRVSAPSVRERRVAIVAFRFGPDIVGGAETSLRTMARAIQDAGHHIEIYTTCTTSESHWRNDQPPGTVTLDGLTVHRFPIDAHDADAHGEVFRAILDADGNVTPEFEQEYLARSIHSAALLEALRTREADVDAIITGPYLFGLTADIARAFPHKTLVAPCFHEEPLARLAIWPRIFGEVAGILYHSGEEQTFAQHELGVHHPNSWVIGTCLHAQAAPAVTGCEPTPKNCPPYVVYCGRYSEQKNVPMLFEWLARYQADCPGRFDVVFMGQGDCTFPSAPWLRDLGRVDEQTKGRLLAGAAALLQLSTHESLSIVVLEAWAAGTPVIVHRDCPVLAGQIERANGGAAVSDYSALASTLDDLSNEPDEWRRRGANGRSYVRSHYTSQSEYAARLLGAIDQMRRPLSEQMRERGLMHARDHDRSTWQRRFTDVVEKVLTQPPRQVREAILVEPMRTHFHVGANTRTLLIPARLTNQGTHAALPDGPGRTAVCVEIRAADSNELAVERREIELPALLAPGQAEVAAIPIAMPGLPGTYRVLLWAERYGPTAKRYRHELAQASLTLEASSAAPPASAAGASVFVDHVQEILPTMRELGELPADYVDVTQGRFASAKRFIKRKLLNNFKRGYVDVLSRRQTEVNGQMVVMIQQLAECCSMLDHAIAGLNQRLDTLEARLGAAPTARENRPLGEDAVHAEGVAELHGGLHG